MICSKLNEISFFWIYKLVFIILLTLAFYRYLIIKNKQSHNLISEQLNRKAIIHLIKFK